MTLDDVLHDIHTLEEEMRAYERKYGVLSATFYESYISGEEPADDAWVRDWTAWAAAYKLWLQLREQYEAAIQNLRQEIPPIADIIEKTARHEPIAIGT